MAYVNLEKQIKRIRFRLASEPAHKVAEFFGVSTVRFCAFCRRNHIAYKTLYGDGYRGTLKCKPEVVQKMLVKKTIADVASELGVSAAVLYGFCTKYDVTWNKQTRRKPVLTATETEKPPKMFDWLYRPCA